MVEKIPHTVVALIQDALQMNRTLLPKWLSWYHLDYYNLYITTSIETNMLQVAANSSVASPAVAWGRNLFFSANVHATENLWSSIPLYLLCISLIHCLGFGSARWRKNFATLHKVLTHGQWNYHNYNTASCRQHIVVQRASVWYNASHRRIARICIRPSRCQRSHEQLEASCSVLVFFCSQITMMAMGALREPRQSRSAGASNSKPASLGAGSSGLQRFTSFARLAMFDSRYHDISNDMKLSQQNRPNRISPHRRLFSYCIILPLQVDNSTHARKLMETDGNCSSAW